MTEGVHKIVFKTPEKEEAEAESKNRDTARGRASVEMMPLKPWGRLPGGAAPTIHVSSGAESREGSTECAVIESERREISAGHKNRVCWPVKERPEAGAY